MTPEERAHRLVSTLFFERQSEWLRADGSVVSIDADPIISAISTAIILAVQAEREACAQVAEMQAGGHYMAKIAAFAIRARSEGTHE